MAPSKNVIFNEGLGSELSFLGPRGPTQLDHAPQFATGRAANADRWSYRYTSNKRQVWHLTFTELSQANLTALETFYYTVAVGPTNTFTYTHTDGTKYTGCRFVNTDLQVSRENDNVFGVTLEIEHSNTQS